MRPEREEHIRLHLSKDAGLWVPDIMCMVSSNTVDCSIVIQQTSRPQEIDAAQPGHVLYEDR